MAALCWARTSPQGPGGKEKAMGFSIFLVGCHQSPLPEAVGFFFSPCRKNRQIHQDTVPLMNRKQEGMQDRAGVLGKLGHTSVREENGTLPPLPSMALESFPGSTSGAVSRLVSSSSLSLKVDKKRDKADF